MATKSKTNISEIEKVLNEDTSLLVNDWEKLEKESIWEKLTPRQEKFCRLYSTNKEFFGNWVKTYLEVYDIDTHKKWWYETASVCASQLLSNPKVYNRINELLDDQWLNDAFVDKQILFLVSQNAELWTKLSAIKEYNSLKQRITKKLELSWWVAIENITIE